MEFIERYSILDKMESGSDGEVYLVMDENLSLKRIMKLVRLEGDQRKKQEFLAEVLLLRELSHPCLPHICDLIYEGDRMMVVMDYIEGETLSQYIKQHGSAKEETVIDWGIQLADLFTYLHGRNPPVYHRDLKPSNIIRHPTGHIFLIDFGISCSSLYKGTPGYAAPEQYGGQGRIDGRADVYGLGMTLRYCLLGENDMGQGHRKDVSKHMDRILCRCTEDNPKSRYGSMEALKEEFVRISQKKGSWKLLRNASKKYGILYFFITLCILWAALLIYHNESRKQDASYYLRCAQEAVERKKRYYYYEKALRKNPGEETIYVSLVKQCLPTNHFTQQDAVDLLNILETTGSLEAFERRNPSSYGQFCYEMGMAYFFYMGGSRGKKESGIWFDRALKYSGKLTDSQKQRGRIYMTISDYHAGFLIYGEDLSGENDTYTYMDFYRMIGSLNKSIESDLDSEAGKKAGQLAAWEVVRELDRYGKEFLSLADIQQEDIMRELDLLWTVCGKGWMDSRQKVQIREKIRKVKNNISQMEVYDEKNHE